MLKLSNLQENIVKALATYKFLTVTHVLEIGISTSKNSTIHQIKKLKDLDLVASSSYSGTFENSPIGVRKVFKYENLHYLTTKGARLVAELFSDHEDAPAQVSAVKPAFSNDYLHRVYTISVQIALAKWLHQHAYKLLLLRTYYSKKKGTHFSATRISITETERCDPDMIVKYHTNEREIAVIIEIWNGVDTGYILDQLYSLYQAIASKKVSEAIEYPKAPRILSIFRYENILELVRKKVQEDSYFDQKIKNDLFLFKTIDNLNLPFGENWIQPSGNSISI